MYTVERLKCFDFLSAEYRQLFDRSTGTLFQHPVWLDSFYSVLVPAVGVAPHVVTVRTSEDGRLVAVLPLVRTGGRFVRRVEFADLGTCDYAMPVVDRTAASALGDDPAVGEAVRRAIGRADLLLVNNVPGSPHLMNALTGATDVRLHDYEAHSVPLPDSFEAWREARDIQFVRHLDRKRARIGRKRRVLALREVTEPAEIDELFELMKAYRRDRFAEGHAVDLMQDPRYFEFYRAVARRGAVGDGPGSTTVLTVNGDPVGVSFGMSDAVTDLFVLIGYDVATWRNYSIGLVMVEELIARSIRDGRKNHDLTVGHGEYKASFGAVAGPVYSVRVPMTPPGRGALAVADLHRAGRRTTKRMIRHWDSRHPQRPVASLLGKRFTS